MSNHSYFNLAGNGNGTILDLLLKASNFTPILKGLILEKTKERKIGERINTNEEKYSWRVWS